MNSVIRITVIEIKFITDEIIGGIAIGRFGINIATSSPQVSELARVRYSAQQLVARRARLSALWQVAAEQRCTPTSSEITDGAGFKV